MVFESSSEIKEIVELNQVCFMRFNKLICIVLYCFISFFNTLYAQNKPYFQQQVNYKIDVKLNDKEHRLTGKIEMHYSNNSPDILDRIGMHLWPNAFSNKNTAYCKQKLLHRNTDCYDATFEESGNIQLFELLVDGTPSTMESIKNNPDMAWLLLPKVLKPGEQIVISSKFDIKIPRSFSRFGHVGQSYQISQWYVKPAVYDHYGWHLMPYLDQGEFYSEFGNFDVTISLPENYYVAGTGEIIDEKETQFIEKRVIETKKLIENKKEQKANVSDSIESSDNWKTIKLKAENVHDFAWFADKSFLILKREASLPSGKKIPTWAYFTDLKYWSKGAEFVTRAVEFYSQNVGEYPWPQATAVQSSLGAGGGMEYPMITVIGEVNSEKSLDIIICHEVGHNWFYGILASNEREHPWLDEGVNSYYEGRYTRKYYKEGWLLDRNIRGIFSRFKISSESELLYQLLSHSNLTQAPGLHSEKFSGINYGYDVYKRVPDLFYYLESYLGTSTLDSIIKSYYQSWKFKHPYPENLVNQFTTATQKDLSWLFRDIMYENKRIDYSICSIKDIGDNFLLKVKNKGQTYAPFQISYIKDDSIIQSSWHDGFEGSQTLLIKKFNIDKLKIDGEGNYFDFNSFDNTIKTKGIFKKTEPLKVGLSSFYNNPDRKDVLIYPSFLWNYVNGGMLGIHVGRHYFPTPEWNFQLSPKYAFKSKSLTGTSEISYRKILNSKLINTVKAGVSAKRFGLQEAIHLNRANHYLQLKPYITVDFKTDIKKAISSILSYEYFFIQDEIENFTQEDSSFKRVQLSNNVHKLSYYYSVPAILGPMSVKVESYFEKYNGAIDKASYLRIDTEFKKSFRWKKKRYFDTRFFVSFFPMNTERSRNSIASRNDQRFIRGSAGAAFQAYHDYTNENNFLDRSSRNNFWAQQIELRQGGLKLAPGVAQRNNIGNTNRFLASLNLSSDLPLPSIGKLVRPYFDVAYVKVDKSLVNGGSYLYSGGVQLKLIPEVLSVYFPLINSTNIKEIYVADSNQSYWRQVTFSFKLQLGQYKDLISLIQ
ncbi:MAG: M1 family metallopeptidase [Saprospiraceae bacterium]|nr:M1 family metallopeptidase [Saprospiraceae bacterium]